MDFLLNSRVAFICVECVQIHKSLSPVCSAHSHPFLQELEGDEEGEDEDDADINPKVSCWGAAVSTDAMLLCCWVVSPPGVPVLL